MKTVDQAEPQELEAIMTRIGEKVCEEFERAGYEVPGYVVLADRVTPGIPCFSNLKPWAISELLGEAKKPLDLWIQRDGSLWMGVDPGASPGDRTAVRIQSYDQTPDGAD